MSHFTVLVAANDKDHLKEVLLPYHEYECTGIEKFLVFVPEDMDELKAKYEEYKEEGQDFDSFVESWCGAKKNAEGVYGRVTNPNAKWDWWSVGGRWSGLLKLKPEAKGQGENGESGIFHEVNTDPAKADSVEAGKVDWEGIRATEIQNAEKRFDKWHEIQSKTLEEAKLRDDLFENGFMFVDPEEVADLNTLTKEQYVSKYGSEDAMTYAFIDTDGEWHGRGEMGWFGMDSNRQDGYNTNWWSFVRSLQPDQKIFIVDCHI